MSSLASADLALKVRNELVRGVGVDHAIIVGFPEYTGDHYACVIDHPATEGQVMIEIVPWTRWSAIAVFHDEDSPAVRLLRNGSVEDLANQAYDIESYGKTR